MKPERLGNITREAVVARMGDFEVSNLSYVEVRVLSGLYLSEVSGAQLARELRMTERGIGRARRSGLTKLGVLKPS